MASPGPGAVPANAMARSDAEAWRDTAAIRLSDRVRALALGVLAFFWAVMSADNGPAAHIHIAHRKWLMITAALAVLSLLFDLFHSLANFRQSDLLVHEMERKKQTAGQMNPKSFLYRSQGWALWLKVALCIASCLSLLLLVGVSL